MRTIAVFNRKGGSGKTTTTINVGAALAEGGHSVLVVDLDPQGSASEWLGVEPHGREIFDALVGTRDLASLAVDTNTPGISLVPASPWLVTAEQTLLGDIGVAITRAIERLPARSDFVLIDCPPTLSYLSVGALTAVRETLIPVETHAIALPGVDAVVREVVRLRKVLNPGLQRVLIAPNRATRTRHSLGVVSELRELYGPLVAQSGIRHSVRVAEAWRARRPVTSHDPHGPVADDFRALAAELAAPPAPAAEERPVRGWRERLGLRRVAAV